MTVTLRVLGGGPLRGFKWNLAQRDDLNPTKPPSGGFLVYHIFMILGMMSIDLPTRKGKNEHGSY